MNNSQNSANIGEIFAIAFAIYGFITLPLIYEERCGEWGWGWVKMLGFFLEK